MIEIFRKRDTIGILVFLVAVAIFIWYFIAKIVVFQKLGYQSDLYTHLEISRGWLQGRPMMHENAYGYHHLLHNYYFNLIMGPLTVFMGVYGIFLIEFLLYILALWYAFPILYKSDASFDYKIKIAVFIITIVCGPCAYWLFDNPHYGFHPEMLYIPLGFIFALSLYKKQRWVAVLSAILMVSIKEDGAVIAASIHLLFFTMRYMAGEMEVKKWLQQSLLWGGIWVVVFLAGILYIKYVNNFGQDRLSEAFKNFGNQPMDEKIKYFKQVFARFGATLFPLGLFLLFIRQFNYKHWLIWIGFMMPVILVNLISGFVYFPASFFSLNWPPRFSLTFALFLAFCSYTLLFFSKTWSPPKFVLLLVGALSGVIIVNRQIHELDRENGYYYPRYAIHTFTEKPPGEMYPHWGQVKSLADVLPNNYPVAPPNKLFGFFHKKDIIWYDRVQNAWVKPRIVIRDETNGDETLRAVGEMANPDSLKTEKITYYFEKEDRHYLQKAGIE